MILLTKTTISPERRAEIKQVVYDALVHSDLKFLPVNIKKICKSFDYIRVIPFSIHMKRRNITLAEVCQFCGTEDACADYYADVGKYVIYYNDVIKWKYITSNRYRWSIAHELGHILLKHHITHDKTRIYRSELSDTVYNYLEEEADYFAQLILVPHVVLLGFRVDNAKKIQIMCKISEPASKKRFYEYRDWKTHVDGKDEYDNKIHSFFYDYIYKKKCKNCDAGIVQRHGKYCPVCGEKNKLEWGDGNIMKYPLLPTHENGKLQECIICHNEETDITGNYCQICGNHIVNLCENGNCPNSEILPSNARYCPVCGQPSSFYNSDFLKAWNHTEIPTLKLPPLDELKLPFV